MMSIMLLASCSQKKTYDPFNVSPENDSIIESTEDYFEIDFHNTEANVKTIHVILNDAVGKNAIFDTGCSGLSISKMEYFDLLKEGRIADSDFRGEVQSVMADGSVINNVAYNIREIAVTDKNGKVHILNDIVATVKDNLGADILVGTSIIDSWAKHSYTVDLENNVIRFQ